MWTVPISASPSPNGFLGALSMVSDEDDDADDDDGDNVGDVGVDDEDASELRCGASWLTDEPAPSPQHSHMPDL